jgi:hypothetical protein
VIVVALQLFVSLLLVGGSLVLFVHSVRQRDFDHSDRLSLAPLEDDTGGSPISDIDQKHTD